MLRRTPLAALLTAATVSGVLMVPAAADDGPVIGGDCVGTSQFVTVCREEPASADSTQQQGGSADTTDGGSDAKPRPQTCAVERLDPQPPAGDPAWDGHKPGDGAIYTRVCLSDALGIAAGAQIIPQVFWAAEAPQVNVDPEQLARAAVDKMLLTGPSIASPRAAGRYVVGMPMWMWINQSPTTYGPNTASASLAGVTVTATAKVSSISWDMGEGSAPVVCNGPGTAYTPAVGKAPSPDCGHTYTKTSAMQQGNKFQGTATATWTVDWQVTAGPGEAGQFTEVRQSAFTVDVREVQVLN
ncbi:ATP/GTP-binding protein [Streptomyces phaeoluteigriseus]